MARPLRLLVASHDASRTGAPLVLLTFLRWIREHTDASVDLVLWRAGPLVDDFAAVVDDLTVLHPPPGRRSPAESFEDALAKLRLGSVSRRFRAARIGARLPSPPHDVLYLNGAGSALVEPHLGSHAPAVAHVHELDRGLTYALQGPGRDRVLGAERVVAVSEAVADLLAGPWGVDRSRIIVVPGSVPVDAGSPSADPPVAVPDGVPLVLAVGSGGWRKGTDLFVEMAGRVREVLPDAHFAWVGPLVDERLVRSQAQRHGLADHLLLVGEVGDPGPWYERADVFVSTAREDPFPLVALEAGAAGLPVVAFDSGGIRELLADGRGHVVGAEDVGALVDAVVAVLDGGDGGIGSRLRAHVAAHHTPEAMAAALWAEVQGVAGSA